MKFPSLIKTSKYSHFNYEPRYYDAVKEEIQGKIKAAKARQNAKDSGEASSDYYPSNISAAFGKRQRKSNQTSMLQLLIAAALFTMVVGWLFLGNDVLYAFLIISPIYFYFRLRKRKAPRV